MSQEFSYQDVAEHNTKKDLYVVIHDKVYDITKFVDEHPGGEEVLLDVGGQDSTEAFEDVGHSDEAREALDKLLVGELKRQAGDPEPSKRSVPANVGTAESTGSGIALYGVVLLGGVIAYFTLQYLQAKNASSQQA